VLGFLSITIGPPAAPGGGALAPIVNTFPSLKYCSSLKVLRLARISHRFSQKRPEAADSLDSRTSAKNSVLSEASSATLQNPRLWLAQTEAAYWL
jgi:hypothetical protein